MERSGRSLFTSASNAIAGILILVAGVTIALSWGAAGYFMALLFSVILISSNRGTIKRVPSKEDKRNSGLMEIRSRGTNRVFTNRDGMLMSYDGLRQEIYQISGKARIKFSEHRARRFCARFRDESGLDPLDKRLMMRHEKFDTTKSI